MEEIAAFHSLTTPHHIAICFWRGIGYNPAYTATGVVREVITMTAMDKPLLTLGQVQAWEARKAELQRQISAAQTELDELDRRLEHASFFVEGIESAQDKPAPPKPPSEEPSEGLPDAIVRAAGQFGRDGALPGVIKKSLVSSGYDMSRFNANPGYFYTVLVRLLQRGRLEKRRNGAYRVPAPTSSPEGETGAVAAPASSSTH